MTERKRESENEVKGNRREIAEKKEKDSMSDICTTEQKFVIITVLRLIILHSNHSYIEILAS